MNYIHANPIVSGFVTEAAHWKYSSARNYENNDNNVLEIDIEWI
jgi:putative transposase